MTPDYLSPTVCLSSLLIIPPTVHVDMHLWYRHTERVQPMIPDRSISEEQLSESAARVRYLVAERLERIWAQCEPYMGSEEGKPDPRFVEAGIRVLDRLSKLYRLDRPVAGDNPPDSEQRVSLREVVRAQILELEQRMTQGL